MTSALIRSDDYFFYTMGSASGTWTSGKLRRRPPSRTRPTPTDCGVPTGIDLPDEVSGRVASPQETKKRAQQDPKNISQRHMVRGHKHRDGLRPGRHRGHADRGGPGLRHLRQRRHPLPAPGGVGDRRARPARWSSGSRPSHGRSGHTLPTTSAMAERLHRGGEHTTGHRLRGPSSDDRQGSTHHVPDRRQDRHGRRDSRQQPRSPTPGSSASARPTPHISTWWRWWSARVATAPQPPPRRWPTSSTTSTPTRSPRSGPDDRPAGYPPTTIPRSARRRRRPTRPAGTPTSPTTTTQPPATTAAAPDGTDRAPSDPRRLGSRYGIALAAGRAAAHGRSEAGPLHRRRAGGAQARCTAPGGSPGCSSTPTPTRSGCPTRGCRSSTSS